MKTVTLQLQEKNIYSNCSITYGLYIILKTVLTLGDNAFWVLLNWLMFLRCNFAASSHYCHTFEGWWWVSLSQGIGRGKFRWGRDGVAQVFQPFAWIVNINGDSTVEHHRGLHPPLCSPSMGLNSLQHGYDCIIAPRSGNQSFQCYSNWSIVNMLWWCRLFSIRTRCDVFHSTSIVFSFRFRL